MNDELKVDEEFDEKSEREGRGDRLGMGRKRLDKENRELNGKG